MRKMVLIPYEQHIRLSNNRHLRQEAEDIGESSDSNCLTIEHGGNTGKNKPHNNNNNNSIPEGLMEHEGEGESKDCPLSVLQEKTLPPLHCRLETDLILFPIDAKNRRKAEALLKYMVRVMDWNERGELVSNGKVYEGSHVSDLLRHALTGVKTLNPIGREEFYKRLIHTPACLFHPSRRELIGRGTVELSSRLTTEEIKLLPPPGIPANNKTVDLTKRTSWKKQWRKI